MLATSDLDRYANFAPTDQYVSYARLHQHSSYASLDPRANYASSGSELLLLPILWVGKLTTPLSVVMLAISFLNRYASYAFSEPLC